jgi:hypothetical protein
VGEVGGGILFRLLILNSVWIIILAVEGEGPPLYNASQERYNKVVGVLYYYVVGLVLPHFG